MVHMDDGRKKANVSQEIEAISRAIELSLERATDVHDSLGAAGANEAAVNRFGEKALKCDIECEAAVLDGLRAAGLHGRAITEEHGDVQIGTRQDYTWVIDGLDGTSQYKKGPGIPRYRYGTMVTAFAGADPLHNDYVVTALKEHARDRLYLAKKNEGTWLVEKETTKRIYLPHCATLAEVTAAAIDGWWDINRTVFFKNLPGIPLEYHLSSARHYLSFLDGETELVLECTRKSNLELACAYGLVREAGGHIVTVEGKSIGDMRYFELAARPGKAEVTIACADLRLAQEVSKACLKEWQEYTGTR